MQGAWVWAMVAFVGACRNSGAEGAAASASASAAPPSVAAAPSAAAAGPVDAHGCLTKLEYLVPPQRYEDADLVRAMVTDGDQVYFRNMRDVFKVPLAGGAPVAHSKGPGLLLSGRATLWSSGQKLLTQSAGEPIFMSAPKAGGDWSTFIDLTSAKLGGGRDAATRILQGLGGRKSGAHASQADFDGENVYFAEVSKGPGRDAPSTSVLKTVPLHGGEPRTLFEGAGEISEVVRAGDRIAFILTLPPSPEQIAQQAADRKAQKLSFGGRGERNLMSVPLAGGAAKKLMRISNIVADTVLGTDGTSVYVSGYQDEEPTQPGIYRADASGASAPERIDERVLSGHAFVTGEELVLVGSGSVEAKKIEHGQMVLTGARTAKSLTRSACIKDGYTLHASAVSGKTALLALFKTDTSLASIAKLALP